jgi:UDPglucose 6-dehydrogenase
MTFTADARDVSGCELVIFARDVPTNDANVSDTSVVLELVDAVVPHLRSGVTLALMSQVPPGFTRQLRERIRGARPELEFVLYYWVETLIFGRAMDRFLHPERLIIGTDDPGRERPKAFDDELRSFGCPIFQMGYESAELTKMAINLYLSAAVTYANTLSDLCESVGACWRDMVPALRADVRIGAHAYIRPGLGIAGGNLERDLASIALLCRAGGVDGSFVEQLIAYNAERPGWVRRKLEEHVLGVVPRPVVGVWGIAYKKGTRSTKNAISPRFIEELRGRADVRVWDPVVRPSDVDLPATFVADRDAVLEGVDALVILTDWDEFAAPSAAAIRRMRRRVIIDAVGVVDPARAELDGVRYVEMGRPVSDSAAEATDSATAPIL